MSIRDVAAASHRSHALVSRYFGSKAGLVDAVTEGLAARMCEVLDAATAAEGDLVTVLLGWARRNRVDVQLLIRCGLGDLQSDPLLADGGPLRRLVEVLGASPTGAAPSRPSQSDVCAYAAASLVLGWLTFDGFISEAVRLTPISPSRRDDAIAMSAHHLSAVASVDHPAFRLRRRRGMIPERRVDRRPRA